MTGGEALFDLTAPELQGWFAWWSLAVGLCVGSFLNVVIARLPEGRSIVRPGSACPRCGAPVRWFDNIPVLSYLWLRGRCRSCGAGISLRYPVVELLTGLLTMAIARQFGPGLWSLACLALVALLVAATWIDLDHWIIPYEITWPGLALGLAASFVAPAHGPLDSVIGGAAGFGLFAVVGLIGRFLFRKEALGQGDWWLLSMIGAFLGWRALLPVVMLASLQGSVVGVLLILIGRAQPGPENERAAAESPERTASAADDPAGDGAADEPDEAWVPPRHAVPFGPFLALGALQQLFLGDQLMAWYEGLLLRLLG